MDSVPEICTLKRNMPEASIVIVTRNRKEKARIAIASAIAQAGDIEVILMDDGSTDGTSELITSLAPTVKIHRSETQVGLIVQRTRSAELVTSPIIISIDDDALFVGENVVRDTLKMFDDPRIAAVAIPHDNHFNDGRIIPWWPPLPDATNRYLVSSFVGTAYALRTDVFRNLGGFHNDLFHWGEETEYCQRLYGAGYVVRLSNSGLIRHYPDSVIKYGDKVNRYILRNIMLTAWKNAPFLYLFPVIAVAILRAIWRGLHGVDALSSAKGFLMGISAILSGKSRRKPISLSLYRCWAEIRKRKIVSMAEMIERLDTPKR